MGIDPVTHKPKNESVFSSIDGQSKNAANLSHMAQWESTRLEVEARLVRESKLRSHSIQLNINPWDDLESPISTLTSKAVGSSSMLGEGGFHSLLLNDSLDPSLLGLDQHSEHNGGSDEDNENIWNSVLNWVDSFPADSPMSNQGGILKEKGELQLDWTNLGNSNLEDCTIENNSMMSFATSSVHDVTMSGEGGFHSLLLNDSLDPSLLGLDQNSEHDDGGGGGGGSGGGGGGGGGGGSDCCEYNENFWNSIFNWVDSFPTDPPYWPPPPY